MPVGDLFREERNFIDSISLSADVDVGVPGLSRVFLSFEDKTHVMRFILQFFYYTLYKDNIYYTFIENYILSYIGRYFSKS